MRLIALFIIYSSFGLCLLYLYIPYLQRKYTCCSFMHAVAVYVSVYFCFFENEFLVFSYFTGHTLVIRILDLFYIEIQLFLENVQSNKYLLILFIDIIDTYCFICFSQKKKKKNNFMNSILIPIQLFIYRVYIVINLFASKQIIIINFA